jgi:hypothetical protein
MAKPSALSVGEFAYGVPAPVGPYVTVSSDRLQALLVRVFELEALVAAFENNLRVEVSVEHPNWARSEPRTEAEIAPSGGAER